MHTQSDYNKKFIRVRGNSADICTIGLHCYKRVFRLPLKSIWFKQFTSYYFHKVEIPLGAQCQLINKYLCSDNLISISKVFPL